MAERGKVYNRIYTPENQQVQNPNSLLFFENNEPKIQNSTIITNHSDDYDDIEDIFENCIRNWIENSELLQPVFDLYFSVIYNENK